MLNSVKDHIRNIPDIMMHLVIDLTPIEDPVSRVVLNQLNRMIYSQVKENLHGAEIS